MASLRLLRPTGRLLVAPLRQGPVAVYRPFSSTPVAPAWGIIPNFWRKNESSPVPEGTVPAAHESLSERIHDGAEKLAEEIAEGAEKIVEEIGEGATLIAGTHEGPPLETFTTIGYQGHVISTGGLDLTSLSTSWGLHPIMRIQSMLIKMHDSFPILGEPVTWCVLIPAVTVAVRAALFYFNVSNQRNAAKMAHIQPQINAHMAEATNARKRGDMSGFQVASMKSKTLMQETGVNPIRQIFFPLTQGAIFMCMFFALRGLGGSGLESLTTEGFGWVTDLSKSDPYYIFPVASSALTYLTMEYGTDAATQNAMAGNMKAIFRVMLIAMIPAVAAFPAILHIYWTTNNLLSLLQALVLKAPFVRRAFRIPDLPVRPKAGEPGYVKPPTFMEAFKSMQNNMVEKATEASKEATVIAQRKAAIEAKERAREAAKASAATRGSRKLPPLPKGTQAVTPALKVAPTESTVVSTSIETEGARKLRKGNARRKQ